MRLVYKFRYPRSEQLDLLAHISKNIYNEANYLVRQEFFANGIWTRYYQLNMLLKESSRNYKLLKAQTSQQILKVVEKNWVSFFKAIKDWKQNPEKYNGRPHIPSYQDKDGTFMLIFTNQNCTINTNNKELVITMSRSFKDAYPQFKEPICIAIPHYPNKDFSSAYQ